MLTKEHLQRYYFGRLFLKDKSLFAIIFLFFSATVISNLIKLETTPFFMWSMFSQKAQVRDTFTLLDIRYDGDRALNIPHTWDQPQNMLLHDPLSLYIARCVRIVPIAQLDYLGSHWMKKHPQFHSILPQLIPTKTAFDEFPTWYKNYLAEVTGAPSGSISVMEKKVRLTPEGFVNGLSADTVLVIP
jgi:hypothetical protein